MLLKEIAEIYFSLPNKILESAENTWVTVASLLEHNVIVPLKEKTNFDAESSVIIMPNDILIKRISPNYINVYEGVDKVLAGPNLIVIRVKQNPCFVAYMLNQSLSYINNMANSGARFNAVNRNIIENIDIPDLPELSQKLIGSVWMLNNKKQLLIEDLAKKEKLKKELIEKNIFKQIGERNNGRN